MHNFMSLVSLVAVLKHKRLICECFFFTLCTRTVRVFDYNFVHCVSAAFRIFLEEPSCVSGCFLPAVKLNEASG